MWQPLRGVSMLSLRDGAINKYGLSKFPTEFMHSHRHRMWTKNELTGQQIGGGGEGGRGVGKVDEFSLDLVDE